MYADMIVLNIDISYDGSWMKRGHTSNVGLGVIIEVCTGFIVDFEVGGTRSLNKHINTIKLEEMTLALWFRSMDLIKETVVSLISTPYDFLCKFKIKEKFKCSYLGIKINPIQTPKTFLFANQIPSNFVCTISKDERSRLWTPFYHICHGWILSEFFPLLFLLIFILFLYIFFLKTERVIKKLSSYF